MVRCSTPRHSLITSFMLTHSHSYWSSQHSLSLREWPYVIVCVKERERERERHCRGHYSYIQSLGTSYTGSSHINTGWVSTALPGENDPLYMCMNEGERERESQDSKGHYDNNTLILGVSYTWSSHIITGQVSTALPWDNDPMYMCVNERERGTRF